MRRFLLSSVVLFSSVVPGFADDVPSRSLVTAATLYPSGASVIRSASFTAPAGENRIIIDDLPLDFDASSLRVEGRGDADFTIVSVDHRVDRLPPMPDSENPARVLIEDEIAALEARMRDLEFEKTSYYSEIAAADTRLEMIDMLMVREPPKMVENVEYQRAGAETWSQVIEILATETQTAHELQHAARRKIGDTDRALVELSEDLAEKRDELAATQLPQPPRSIATVELSSDVALSGTLELSYRVASAGWQPVYDLRLDQSGSPMLAVERHARVFQRTGEDWQDVALTLSTARPSQRMATPELPAQMATLLDPKAGGFGNDLYRSEAEAAPSIGLNAEQSRLVGARDRAQIELLQDTQSPTLMQDEIASVQTAEMETLGQTIVYRLSNEADVAGDGTIRQLGIDAKTLPADVLARSTPAFDTNAYLYASLENGFGSPILPGPASVFRDGTFVGEIGMPMITAGQNAALPFGVLDGVEVARHTLQREDGDFGIIGTTNQRVESYELSAKSTLSYPIIVTLYDRAPFSEDEDLQIDVTSQPEASVVDLDGKRGVRNWSFELEPGAENKISVEIDIRWPGDMALSVQ